MTEPGNPILVKFLEDWRDEAKQLGLESAFAYNRAYESMKACPVTFNHPREATRLPGISPDILDRLVGAYDRYCSIRQQHRDAPAPANEVITISDDDDDDGGRGDAHIPQSDQESSADMGAQRPRLQRPHRALCNKFSAARPAPSAEQLASSPTQSRQHTASSSARYPASSSTNPREHSASALTEFNPTVLRAGTYSVQVVIGGCNRDDAECDRDDAAYNHDEVAREHIYSGLVQAGHIPASRELTLGDVLWVARSGEHEVMLDYIVQREHLDDLVLSLSIGDGIFHEKKLRRLTKGAVQNVIYVVEGTSLPQHVRSDPAVQMSIDRVISRIQVVHGIFVKRTASLYDTIRYLARLTHMLQKKIYADKDLLVLPDHRSGYPYPASLQVLREQLKQHGSPHPSHLNNNQDYYLSYDTFSALAADSPFTTLRDVYVGMLMCVRGVTAPMAVEIQRRFKTPRDLLEAYEHAQGDVERNGLLVDLCGSANLVGGDGNAADVSRRIRQVWLGGGDDGERHL